MSTLENRPNTALLVVDVQNGALGGAHERDAVVANVGALVDRARQADVPVVWVQHNDEQGLPRGSDEWRNRCRRRFAHRPDLFHFFGGYQHLVDHGGLVRLRASALVDGDPVLGRDVERRAAGDDQLQVGAAAQDVAHEPRRRQDVLEVVEDDQRLARAQEAHDRLRRGLAALACALLDSGPVGNPARAIDLGELGLGLGLGHDQARRFSWLETAHGLASLYRRLAGSAGAS